jgi:hypothetical protein
VLNFAAWLDSCDPISDVFPMAGLHNTLRRLVVGGTPVVTGLHAIGDTVCTTNPTFGRGLSLALSGALDLLDVIADHRDDPAAQALALDGLVADHVVPFYEDQAAIDRARLTALTHAIYAAPPPVPAPANPGRVSFAELRTAASADPTAFRAFWEIFGMTRRPEDVYTDPRGRAHPRGAQEPRRPNAGRSASARIAACCPFDVTDRRNHAVRARPA